MNKKKILSNILRTSSCGYVNGVGFFSMVLNTRTHVSCEHMELKIGRNFLEKVKMPD
jgi:hypothetical protein